MIDWPIIYCSSCLTTENIFLFHPSQGWHFLISGSIEWSTHDPFVLMLMNDCFIPILSDFGAVESIASPWRGKFVIHQPSRLSGLNEGKSRCTVWGVHCFTTALWSCEVEWMALITAALQWKGRKKNAWLVLIAGKPCRSPKVWRRSTLSVPSLGN